LPRRKFEPTDELRRKVQTLAGLGVSQTRICHLIGVRSLNTLRKHFRHELKRGPIEALAQVQQTAFRLATSGRNPKATIAWLSRMARWGPGFRSRPEPGELRKVTFVVETYQPPVDDSLDRLALLSTLQGPAPPAEWDGDSPNRGSGDDG
jgi:hypothetical protein